MEDNFNHRIRQVLLLLVLIGLALLLFKELYVFFPGFLGAITLYILCRGSYIRLTEGKKRNKSWIALLFIIGFLLCIALPIYLSIRLLSPRIDALISNQQEILNVVKSFGMQIQEWTGQELFNENNLQALQKAIAGFIPSLLNSTASFLANLMMLLFMAYFMLTNSGGMERALRHLIPLRPDNIGILAGETKSMVKANAIGIPLISVIQGTVAFIGYWIFGVGDNVMWGFLTGVFAFFPILGTMVIWIPLVVYLYSIGKTGPAIGLAAYSAIITGNIDYLARITLLKKIGNVHPLITVLGLIVGLKLFGFWGFIFGPLIVSYFLLLLKIYGTEFGWMEGSEEARG
jgi:predicted PurR-regulated permease PerM